MKQEKENTTGLSIHNMHTYLHTDMQQDLQTFTGGIKSGYTNIDDLYTGLYVIGGSSAIGKTTFVHQMADQIAETGYPVLYITLEQSALELASKSLSRIMAKQDAATAMTSLQIRKKEMIQELQKLLLYMTGLLIISQLLIVHIEQLSILSRILCIHILEKLERNLW